MSKFRNWKDVKKEIEADFTEEDIQFDSTGTK